MIAQRTQVDGSFGCCVQRWFSRSAAGGPRTSLATIAFSKVFPSWNIVCKAPLLRGGCGFAGRTPIYGDFAGGASGAGAEPLSAAAPTLVEIAPRMSESA